MKRFSIFALFLLITLAISMVGYYFIENAESKRTISKELYCMTKDAVPFKIEVIHNINLNNPYQVYADIQKYFVNIEYKDRKDGLIRLRQHLINIHKDDAYDVYSIRLYKTKQNIKFKYI